MKVTIVGAGNAGLAHAAMMREAGNEVTLLKTTNLMYQDTFDKLKRVGEIKYIKDGKEGATKGITATRDIKEAISGAEIIFIMTQSVAHEALSHMICPYLKDRQIVVVSPGYCGSFYFSRQCLNRNILFAEGESQPFDARIVGTNKVHICSENVRNPIGVFPSRETEYVLDQLLQVLPKFTARHNILESALHNPNLIVHTIGTIMSVSRIEYSGGDFWMYREAFTPSIWNLVNDLDAEKIAILEYFDLPAQRFSDSFHYRNYENLEADPMEAFHHYAKFGSPKGPYDAQTRYITEDVPMGLCFMSSIGRKIGVNTPVCDSLIKIASSIHQRDYYTVGRTLGNLGLSSYTKEELKQILENGWSSVRG